MKILVLNCGSSSIKYALYNMDDKSVMTSGGAERVGLDEAFVKVKMPDGTKKKVMHDIPEHTEGVKFIFSLLTDPEIGVIKSLDEIDAVGHRMVHGGEKFNKSVVLTDEVLKTFEECIDLAPLHNPANLKGVKAVSELMPGLPQVGVFDTAFHQTMPAHSYLYAIPYDLYEKYGVRRYGFHGTSHRYVSHRVCDFLGVKMEDKKIITCHIGNGGSVSAVQNGKCVDTSMGLTPLEGLMMGTRSGSIDPAIVTYLMRREHKTFDEMDRILNKESGILGVSGLSADMRDVLQAADEGDEWAELAIEMYVHRVQKAIGGYYAIMTRTDAVVMTAGIGENSAELRERIFAGLAHMGMILDKDRNNVTGEIGLNRVISVDDSPIKICIVTADEEIRIARETDNLVSQLG